MKSQLRAGHETQLKPVYSICIVAGRLWPDSTKVHSRFRLTDNESERRKGLDEGLIKGREELIATPIENLQRFQQLLRMPVASIETLKQHSLPELRAIVNDLYAELSRRLN